MNPKTQEAITAALAALDENQGHDIDSPAGLALHALRKAAAEIKRLDGIATRARYTAAGMLDAMRGHSDHRQAALARVGLEALAQTHD
jgi:hypothetical protein